jgi:drug/metabolite transporter (DMT)-like permease
MMFWPKLVGAEFNTHAAVGLGMCIAGTLSFCFGNMVSADAQRRSIGVVPATAWGMFYGMLFLGLFSALRGQSFAVEWSLSYFTGLAYLSIIASVVAFASYLTLLGRIGSARAGYATVMFPVVALTLSTIFEGYQWTAIAALGLVCVLCGNVLMLRAR